MSKDLCMMFCLPFHLKQSQLNVHNLLFTTQFYNERQVSFLVIYVSHKSCCHLGYG